MTVYFGKKQDQCHDGIYTGKSDSTNVQIGGGAAATLAAADDDNNDDAKMGTRL